MGVTILPREPPFAVVLLSYPDEGSFTYMTPLLIRHKSEKRLGDIQAEVQGVIVHPPQVGDKVDVRELRKKASEHEEGAEAEEEEYSYSRQTTLDEFLSGRGEDG